MWRYCYVEVKVNAELESHLQPHVMVQRLTESVHVFHIMPLYDLVVGTWGRKILITRKKIYFRLAGYNISLLRIFKQKLRIFNQDLFFYTGLFSDPEQCDDEHPARLPVQGLHHQETGQQLFLVKYRLHRRNFISRLLSRKIHIFRSGAFI